MFIVIDGVALIAVLLWLGMNFTSPAAMPSTDQDTAETYQIAKCFGFYWRICSGLMLVTLCCSIPDIIKFVLMNLLICVEYHGVYLWGFRTYKGECSPDYLFAIRRILIISLSCAMLGTLLPYSFGSKMQNLTSDPELFINTTLGLVTLGKLGTLWGPFLTWITWSRADTISVHQLTRKGGLLLTLILSMSLPNLSQVTARDTDFQFLLILLMTLCIAQVFLTYMRSKNSFQSQLMTLIIWSAWVTSLLTIWGLIQIPIVIPFPFESVKLGISIEQNKFVGCLLIWALVTLRGCLLPQQLYRPEYFYREELAGYWNVNRFQSLMLTTSLGVLILMPFLLADVSYSLNYLQTSWPRYKQTETMGVEVNYVPSLFLTCGAMTLVAMSRIGLSVCWQYIQLCQAVFSSFRRKFVEHPLTLFQFLNHCAFLIAVVLVILNVYLQLLLPEDVHDLYKDR